MAIVVFRTGRSLRAIYHGVLALIAVCGLSAAASAQTTVTLDTPGTQINADLTIQGGASAMTDFSSSPILESKVSTPSYTRRILLKFDTQDYIPAGAVIQSARLYLVLQNAESAENRPFTAYNVSQSFVKGQTNWYYYRTGAAWSSGGGDLSGAYGTSYVNNNVNATYTFDLTQLVQRAVNGDFGSRYTRVALIDTGAATSGNYRAFYSTRATDPSLRPRLVITYGASSVVAPPPPPAPAPPPPPPPSSTTLRLMQYNIHKTKDSTGACDPDFTARTIVGQHPDVVSLNEVNFFAGDCAWNFDMSEKLLALVESYSGQTWYKQTVNPNGVGNVLLSRYPLISSSSYNLDFGRGVAQIAIAVNGRTINLFSTHIEYVTASWRPIQIAELLAWMNNFSSPRIVMGDFNTWYQTTDYYTITNVLQDSWISALNSGSASSYNGTGATEGLSRIDYAFFLSGGVLSVKSANVPDTVVNGVKPSDHDPLIVVFSIN